MSENVRTLIFLRLVSFAVTTYLILLQASPIEETTPNHNEVSKDIQAFRFITKTLARIPARANW